jgi:hypothetical protein
MDRMLTTVYLSARSTRSTTLMLGALRARSARSTTVEGGALSLYRESTPGAPHTCSEESQSTLRSEHPLRSRTRAFHVDADRSKAEQFSGLDSLLRGGTLAPSGTQHQEIRTRISDRILRCAESLEGIGFHAMPRWMFDGDHMITNQMLRNFSKVAIAHECT